ncbi:hypothetical protein [Shinella zoogloeoides]|uniref:hypothetical protein n=1 Tax=Shinella zoogloeoides TaxID=352475 RepID=UPI001F566264|nr:hypothetical protein [Shinella zoogloeoides]
MPSALLSPDNDYKFPPEPVPAELDREQWDHVMASIGARMRALEAVGTGIEAIQAELQSFGVQRLDEAINPLIEQTQADIAALQQTLATIDADADGLLADVQAQADALIASVQQDVQALRAQIDLILAYGIPAANVEEDASRVFVTPEEKASIAQKADAAAVYTKSEVDAGLSDKADAADTYTKTEVDAAIAETSRRAAAYALAFGGR